MKVLAAIIIVAVALGSARANLFGVTLSSEPILQPSATSNTPIQTLIPSPTPIVPIPTLTQTPKPTSTPMATLTPVPTLSPFPISSSFDPTPIITFESTVYPFEAPMPTPTPTPTVSPTPTPTPTASPTPTPTPTPRPQGVISITFDDGTRSQYTVAFPLMRDRNIVGTFYIPTANFTANPYNKISPTELLQMQSAGNEIGSHSVSHPDFTKLTETQIRQECADSKTTLQSYGLTINNFAYPYGTGDLNNTNKIVSQYYRSARIVNYTPPMTIANASFQLSAVLGESQGEQYANLLPKLKRIVDNTVNNNQWTVFYMHNIASNNEVVTYGGISVEDFTSFLNYAKASGAQILTVNQALNLAMT